MLLPATVLLRIVQRGVAHDLLQAAALHLEVVVLLLATVVHRLVVLAIVAEVAALADLRASASISLAL